MPLTKTNHFKKMLTRKVSRPTWAALMLPLPFWSLRIDVCRAAWTGSWLS